MLRIAAVTLLAARLAAVSADDYEYVTEGSIKCDADGSGTATSADLLFNYENTVSYTHLTLPTKRIV